MRAGAIVLAIAGAMTLPLSGAGSQDDLSLPRWYVYRVSTDSVSPDPVFLLFDVTWGGPAAIYDVAYWPDGSIHGPGWASFSGTGAHAGVTVADHSAEFLDVTGAGAATYGFALAPTGQHDVVVLMVGDLWSVDVRLDGVGRLELVAEGPGEARSGHEMEGVAFADATVVDATARAAAIRTLDLTIEGYLFGWFLTPLGFPGETVGLATLASANSIDQCGLNDTEGQPVYLRTRGCWFMEFEGPAARGAGSYRLEWTGVNVQDAHAPLMGWADIPASVAPRR